MTDETPGRPRGLVALLLVAVAAIGANSLALSPVLGDVAADLGASPVAVARAGAAYGGATALSALLLGRLIDRLGALRSLVAALSVLAVAMLASAAAVHWLVLAAAQAAAGGAAGLALPAIYALAAAVAPPGREAATLGRVLTGWSVAMVAGVPLAALVAGTASWRVSYLGLAVLLALAAVALARGAGRAAGRAPDRGGATVSSTALVRRRPVAVLLAANLLFMTAFYGVYAFIGDGARRALGLGPEGAGLIVLAYGLGFGLGALGDRIIDRFGIARLLPAVMAGAGLVYAAMTVGLVSLSAALGLAGAWGFLNHFGLNMLVLGLTRAAPDARGGVLALNSAVSYLGAFVGAAAFGPLYDRAGLAGLATAAAILMALAAGLTVWLGRGAAGRAGDVAPDVGAGTAAL